MNETARVSGGAVLAERPAPPEVQALLAEARVLVGMEVAFVSRFSAGHRVIEAVDAAGRAPFAPGDSDPVEDTYCQRIVDRRLPQAVPDTAREPEAARLPVTEQLGVRSHTGVPIVLDDGTLYGTLCAYSSRVRPVDERDSAILTLLARGIARHLPSARVDQVRREATHARLDRLLAQGELRSVLQPIVEVTAGRIVAAEALSRFPEPGLSPAQWFEDASTAGRRVELEMAAVQAAVGSWSDLPQGVALSLNVGAEVLLSDPFLSWLEQAPADRVILELTEHHTMSAASDQAVVEALAPARRRGVRLALDEFGSGQAGLQRTLLLEPDLLKLGRAITGDLHEHPGKRALCRALVSFAGSLRAKVVAGGIESAAELEVVRRLGIDYAQGFHISRPVPLVDVDWTARPALRAAGGTPTSQGVRSIIEEMLHEGASADTVAARLNRLGERTAAGVRWHATSVRDCASAP